MSRVIFIGDLHGCVTEAKQLLEKCHATAEDHVVFLGDLIDRGPDNAECVDLAMRIEARQGKPACILGNHEQRHIEYDNIEKKKGHVRVDNPTHAATRMQLKPEHYEYMRKLPLYLRLPEHNVVAVHAGVYPGRTIEEQEARHLLHVQMVRPYDKFGNPTYNTKSVWPSRVPSNEEGWRFWSTVWDGPEFIVFGHSVIDKPLITDKVAGIDGGVVFGRELHAYILPEKKVVTIKGTKDYGKGRRGQLTEEEKNQGIKIKTYLIHNDVSAFS